METSTLPLWITLECLALGFGHYMPHWKKVLGPLSNPIRLMFNYTYGTLSIGGAFVGWLLRDLPTNPYEIAWTFCGFCVVGGVVVAFTYFVDWIDSKVQTNKTQNALLERQKRDVETERN